MDYHIWISRLQSTVSSPFDCRSRGRRGRIPHHENKSIPFSFFFFFFTAQSTQWGHVERGQFTLSHIYWAGLVLYAVNQYCAHSFVRHWQLPFLNQQKGENDRRKYFTINLHERMLLTSAGVEPATSWSPVGWHIQLSHRGQVYSIILKILPPKNENFQIKILIFFIFFSKHRLWVLVRTTSARQFLRVPTIYVFEQK